MFALAMRTLAGRELIELARPFLADLAAATGETAVLGALAEDAEGLAAPVSDSSGEVVAEVLIAGPAAR